MSCPASQLLLCSTSTAGLGWGGRMSIVMGLDQHRAQITAEWIDTSTGEVSRGRVAPADRAGVRRFLRRFAGEELEVALEATTGWRFVVEELRRVGPRVHLAEPVETSARKGSKKRAKTDRADARHLRELLMIDRLPESWIPPEHILDLRARVRSRHTLSHQRCEWQQRIQAVLYHHGCPHRRSLMVGDGREWLDAQPLPAPSTNQTSIARPASCPARGRPRCAGRYMRPRKSRVAQTAPTAPTICRPQSGSAATAPAWPSRGSSSSAATTPCASSARRRSCPPDLPGARQALNHTDAPRPAPEDPLPPPSRGRPRKIERPQRLHQRDHPHQTSRRRPRSQPGSRTEVSPGARAHNIHPRQRAHAPPESTTPDNALDSKA
jgi:hypothetical protein